MKRILTPIIAGATVAAVMAGPVQASPHEDRWRGPCDGWQYGEALVSPAVFNQDLARSHRMMERLVVCVFRHFAPGNEYHALYVVDRESGFMPWAVNHGGCGGSGCLGLFQHMGSAWAERARNTLWKGWFKRWPAHWADPRANAIVSARMVRAGGWGPWGG